MTAHLTPPNAENRQFSKNFHFVVEFRFPALLEISQESQVVATVQKAVREKFPIYNKNLSANLTPVGMSHVTHEFRDKTQKSVIALSCFGYVLYAKLHQFFRCNTPV